MKRLFAVVLLFVLATSQLPVYAHAGTSAGSQARDVRKAQKRQAKAQKKYVKAQKKAERKMLKTERKNSTRYPAHR
jgi:Sec-independent protein translocase protein TatA